VPCVSSVAPSLMSSDEDLGGGGGRRRGLGGGGLIGGRKRRQNDDNILGSFAEGGDDSPPRKGKGKGKKGKEKKGGEKEIDHTPIRFLAGAVLNKTAVPEKKPRRSSSNDKKSESASDSEHEFDPRFKLTAKTPEHPVEQGPKLQAKNQMSFNEMSTQYGMGYAMMMKMGFKGGGLGRHEDGIANPIEVNVRKGKAGIQDEGEKVDQDLYGNEGFKEKATIEELLGGGSNNKSKEPKASEGWKKGERGAKKPRTVYKTAAEVAAEAGEQSTMRIIDMRGPETKIASSFSELQSALGGDTVKSLKELRHNTRLLVAKYEDKIRSIAEKKKHYEDVLLAVSKECEQTKAAKGLSASDLKQCKSMVKKIDDLRSLQDQGTITIKEMAASFSSLRSDQPKAFKALRVFDVAVALAVPLAKKELAAWKPLQRPNEGISALASWKGVLETEDVKAITILCDEVLLPKLRSALIDWSVRDFDSCILLFECCRKMLPPTALEDLGAHVVVPRLQVEIDSWDPRKDKMPLHIWIHPWLPILGSQLNILWTPIRFKLSACLEQWDTRDRSACGVLKPWQHVFEPANWDPLLEKVLFKLERAIAITPVKPSGQDLTPVEDLLAWLDVVPVALVARVLETALFPQWHAALRQWLRAPECDFNEVLQWYQGWRTLLPEALREVGSVQKQLARGLEVMKSHMSGGGDDSEEEVAEDSKPPPAEIPQRLPSPPPRRTAPSMNEEDVTMNLSDYMGEVAAEHGLTFRPKGRTTQSGNKVYQFGSASVYFDKNLVYAAARGGGDEWHAVSFDEVLKLALKEKKGK